MCMYENERTNDLIDEMKALKKATPKGMSGRKAYERRERIKGIQEELKRRNERGQERRKGDK